MVHRLSILRVSALLATAVLAVSTSATTVLTDSLAVQRPLSEFLEAQGTFCLDHGRGGCFPSVPPVGNLLGWASPRQNRAASVDYAGLANKAILGAGGASLGTVTEGTVLERPLTDGRAEITVTLHTRQALTWVIEGDGQGNFDVGAGTLLFGHRVPEVLGGARPALGDSLLEVVFTNPSSGAPLPDLEQILFAPAPGQELRFISFFASASDPLRERSGVPDGTPERMEVTQSGLLLRPFMDAVSGGFMAERVDLFTHGRASTTDSSDDVAVTQSACRGNRPCNDGNPCTSGDRCNNGVCVGTPYSCNDGNVCTTDTCNGAGGCTFTNNTAPCSDGNGCTSNDTCSAGACVSGPPTYCSDGNTCTTDSCDPATGCIFTNNTAPCDDGNACTTDSCDPATAGCIFTNNTAPCDDGNACTFGDACSGGVCTAGTPYTCDDGNPCTDDACDGSGACIITPIFGCGCPNEFECYSGDNCPGGYFCDSFGCCIPHCFDGVHNFSESDVDCGGSCPGCAAGMHCESWFDCLSGVCVSGVCQ